MAVEKKDVKENVLPHSKAKLDLYKSYLKMYLPILGQSIYVNAINVFDIFCGTGIYKDGNLGSPLIAASCIQDYETSGKYVKPIKLFINDFDASKVSSVKSLIGGLELKTCKVEFFNLDASEMFKVVSDKINAIPDKERSLVFIDPYGYSKINKENIYNILQKGKSEIILFLPVAHMKRFSEGALKDLDNKAYENLRKFINDFLPDDSPIKKGAKIKIFDYIEELKKAFSFEDKFYTASHYIERDASNYYALFFIGSHIYGLEKFVEAKWQNSSLGKGFNQKENSNTLFSPIQGDIDKNITIDNLKKLLDKLFDIEEVVSNRRLYVFTLKNQFKTVHMNEVLRDWYKAKKLKFFDANGKEMTTLNSFGLTYKHYKEKKDLFKFKRV